MSRNRFRAFFKIPLCWLQNVHFWDRRKNVDMSRFRYGIFVLKKKYWSCKLIEAFAWTSFCSVHFLNHSPRIDTRLEGLTSQGINTLCICFWSATFFSEFFMQSGSPSFPQIATLRYLQYFSLLQPMQLFSGVLTFRKLPSLDVVSSNCESSLCYDLSLCFPAESLW